MGAVICAHLQRDYLEELAGLLERFPEVPVVLEAWEAKVDWGGRAEPVRTTAVQEGAVVTAGAATDKE